MIRRREFIKGWWRGVEERQESIHVNREALKGNTEALKKNGRR